MSCITILCNLTEKNPKQMTTEYNNAFVSSNEVSYFTQQDLSYLKKSNFTGIETTISKTAKFCRR